MSKPLSMSQKVSDPPHKNLSKRQMREEAAAMIALSQAEARSVADRIRADNLRRLGVEPKYQSRRAQMEESERAERLRLINFSRLPPSQRMAKAKQEYIGLETLENEPGTGEVKVKEVKTTVSAHPAAYRSISPSFFSRLHNAIKMGYPKGEDGKAETPPPIPSRLTNVEAQKLIQKAAIDMAAYEANGGEMNNNPAAIGETRRGRKKARSKPSISFHEARQALSLGHAPTFPLIDLLNKNTPRVFAGAELPGRSILNPLDAGAKGNAEKKTLRFADEGATSVATMTKPAPADADPKVKGSGSVKARRAHSCQAHAATQANTNNPKPEAIK